MDNYDNQIGFFLFCTDDKKGQWQALEGLGAVCFNNGQMSRCINYLKLALAALAASSDNPHAQERIIGKLTDALQFQLDKSSANDDHNNMKPPSVSN